MRKIKITLFLLAFIVSGVNAQNATIDNVLGLRSKKSAGEIRKDKKIVGYYVFFFKEKVDKKNSAYEVQTFDDNYNPVKSFEITRPKSTILVEMAYNGSVFLFHFYDKKTGYEYITYNTDGEKQGSYIVPADDISRYDLMRVQQAIAGNANTNFIYTVGDQGFMRSTFSKNKKMGYELLKLNNNAKKEWTVESPEDSKMLETMDISDVNEEITVGMITRKSSMLTKSFDVFGVLIDTKTGEIIQEIEMGSDAKGRKSMMKSFISPESQSISIIGEFYKPKDDILKDRSQGLYIQQFSMDGKQMSLNTYKWKGDFDKFKQANLDEEDVKDDKRPFYIFFHDVILTKDGNIIIIGEQFIKQISAGAVIGKVASAALGGSSNASTFEIRIGNMVVIELDKSRKLTNYDIVQKKKTSVLLPEGYGLVSSMVLGYML